MPFSAGLRSSWPFRRRWAQRLRSQPRRHRFRSIESRRGSGTPAQAGCSNPPARPTFKSRVEQRQFVLTLEQALHRDFDLNEFQRQSAEWRSKCCGYSLGQIFEPIEKKMLERKIRKTREQIVQELRLFGGGSGEEVSGTSSRASTSAPAGRAPGVSLSPSRPFPSPPARCRRSPTSVQLPIAAVLDKRHATSRTRSRPRMYVRVATSFSSTAIIDTEVPKTSRP